MVAKLWDITRDRDRVAPTRVVPRSGWDESHRILSVTTPVGPRQIEVPVPPGPEAKPRENDPKGPPVPPKGISSTIVRDGDNRELGRIPVPPDCRNEAFVDQAFAEKYGRLLIHYRVTNPADRGGGFPSKVEGKWAIYTLDGEIRPLAAGSGIVEAQSGRCLLTAKEPASFEESVPPPILWDGATGQEIRRFTRPGYRLSLLGFTPDGRSLVLASAPQTEAEPLRFHLHSTASGEEQWGTDVGFGCGNT